MHTNRFYHESVTWLPNDRMTVEFGGIRSDQTGYSGLDRFPEIRTQDGMETDDRGRIT